MAISYIPEALHGPPITLMNYDELLQRLEDQNALAREMIARARGMSHQAKEMRNQLHPKASNLDVEHPGSLRK